MLNHNYDGPSYSSTGTCINPPPTTAASVFLFLLTVMFLPSGKYTH